MSKEYYVAFTPDEDGEDDYAFASDDLEAVEAKAVEWLEDGEISDKVIILEAKVLRVGKRRAPKPPSIVWDEK